MAKKRKVVTLPTGKGGFPWRTVQRVLRRSFADAPKTSPASMRAAGYRRKGGPRRYAEGVMDTFRWGK